MFTSVRTIPPCISCLLTFIQLIPTLFYFSVWELGIAGHELTLLTTLSPILLSIPGVLNWARTREGLVTLHILSFTGLVAFILPKPSQRLLLAGLGTVSLMMRQVVEWSGEDVGYQSICGFTSSF